jgi:hypothetical protein
MANAAIWAPVKSLRRKSASGSIGDFERCWISTNATSAATAPASSPMISALPQPSSLPRSSASTSRNRPELSVIWPGQSSPRAFGSRDSRTQRAVPTRPMIPSGTLTRKTASQPNPVVSAPPTAGPTANEAPIVAP